MGVWILLFSILAFTIWISYQQDLPTLVTRVANTPTVHLLKAISPDNIESKLKDKLKTVARELRKEEVALANCLTPFKVVHALAALKVITLSRLNVKSGIKEVLNQYYELLFLWLN